jgi:hypothetical protein
MHKFTIFYIHIITNNDAIFALEKNNLYFCENNSRNGPKIIKKVPPQYLTELVTQKNSAAVYSCTVINNLIYPSSASFAKLYLAVACHGIAVASLRTACRPGRGPTSVCGTFLSGTPQTVLGLSFELEAQQRNSCNICSDLATFHWLYRIFSSHYFISHTKCTQNVLTQNRGQSATISKSRRCCQSRFS